MAKNGILSRSDVVEIMSSSYRPCRWWRAYFKRYGWKWNVIWKDAAEKHYIDITNKDSDLYNYCDGGPREEIEK